MVLKLRLTRRGRTGVPVYWLVAAHSSVKRDGIFKSKLGVYAPLNSPEKKLSLLDESKLLGYLKNGAVPTDTVVRLLTTYAKESMQEALTRYPLRKDRCAKSALVK